MNDSNQGLQANPQYTIHNIQFTIYRKKSQD